MAKLHKRRRLADAYTFSGFRPLQPVQGLFGDPGARLVTLVRRGKNDLRYLRRGVSQFVRPTAPAISGLVVRRSAHLPRLGGASADCGQCGAVKRERLDFPVENALHTRRFAL
jgi:hypothetical protein